MNNHFELTDEQLAIAVGGVLDTNTNLLSNTIAATATSTNAASADQTNLIIGSVVQGATIGGVSLTQNSATLQKIDNTLLQLNS
jgi:hypothetical protein